MVASHGIRSRQAEPRLEGHVCLQLRLTAALLLGLLRMHRSGTVPAACFRAYAGGWGHMKRKHRAGGARAALDTRADVGAQMLFLLLHCAMEVATIMGLCVLLHAWRPLPLAILAVGVPKAWGAERDSSVQRLVSYPLF